MYAVSHGCPDVDYETGYVFEEPVFGKCYHFVNRERYWTEANDFCRSKGGDLVTVSAVRFMLFVCRISRMIFRLNHKIMHSFDFAVRFEIFAVIFNFSHIKPFLYKIG